MTVGAAPNGRRRRARLHLGSVNEACVRGGEYELEHSMSARGCTGKAGQLVAVLGRRSSHAAPHDTRRAPINHLCQLGRRRTVHLGDRAAVRCAQPVLA